MKIDCKLSITRPSHGDADRKYIRIELVDDDASIQFASVEVPLDNFSEALTGLSRVDCTAELRGLDKVGLVKEQREERITIKKEVPYDNEARIKLLAPHAAKFEKDGWQWRASATFNTQGKIRREETSTTVFLGFERWVPRKDDAGPA